MCVGGKGACLICRNVTCRQAAASASAATTRVLSGPLLILHQLFNVGSGIGKYFACALSKSILYARPFPGVKWETYLTLRTPRSCSARPNQLASAGRAWVWAWATCPRRASFVLAANLSNARWQPTKLSLFGYHFPGCFLLSSASLLPVFGYLPEKPLPKPLSLGQTFAAPSLPFQAHKFCALFPHFCRRVDVNVNQIRLSLASTRAKVHTSNAFQGWLPVSHSLLVLTCDLRL